MTQAVIDLLLAYAAFSEPFLKKLSSCLIQKEFARGKIVLRAGEICRYIYFIEEGVFRSYVIRGTKEINIWFMLKGDMASAPKSFINQEPAKEYIVAMKKTKVTCISLRDLEALGQEFPAFQTMVLKLLWKYHTQFYDRLIDLLDKTPDERLQYLMEKQPEIWNGIKEKYLSSYLGMSVSTWNRAKHNKLNVGLDKGYPDSSRHLGKI